MEQSIHPRTLFDKIWEAHAISEEPGQGTLLYIDRHLMNEVTTPQPFASLKASG
jgi:3-isopropylmalate/(R)-2-methylmalate dehydratase large subunit